VGTLKLISEREKNELYLGEFIAMQKEDNNINECIKAFVTFSNQVIGGLNSRYSKRYNAEYSYYMQLYRRTIDCMGSDNFMAIVANNIFMLYINDISYNEAIIKTREKLLKEYNIKSHDDLDLRLNLTNRDYIVFWDSILFMIYTDDLK